MTTPEGRVVDQGRTEQAAGRRVRVPMWSLRLWLLAAAVLALLAVSTGAVATFTTRSVVTDATSELVTRLRPAQAATQQLVTAYVDKETGERGFALTGAERFLEPYRQGERRARQLEDRLKRLLAKDQGALRLLRLVQADGDAWNARVRDEIRAVRAQGLEGVHDASGQLADKRSFARLRNRLDALANEVNGLVDAEVRRLSTARKHVDTAMVIALCLSIAALGCTVALLWLALTRPLRLLVGQLDTVTRGHYRRSIDVTGPEEIRRIAQAAETMRMSIVDRSAELAAAQHELGVQNERQRLAADLHDTTIQRLFGLGLKLSALASQRTELATTLNGLIDEADEIIRQLRRMIFELESSRTEIEPGTEPASAPPAGAAGPAAQEDEAEAVPRVGPG